MDAERFVMDALCHLARGAILNIEDNLVVKRAPQLAACELDGGSAVIDLTTGSYFKLNSSAAFIYSLLDAPKSFGAILSAMSDHFDAEDSVLDADLRQLVTQLTSEGLIVIEP